MTFDLDLFSREVSVIQKPPNGHRISRGMIRTPNIRAVDLKPCYFGNRNVLHLFKIQSGNGVNQFLLRYFNCYVSLLLGQVIIHSIVQS